MALNQEKEKLLVQSSRRTLCSLISDGSLRSTGQGKIQSREQGQRELDHIKPLLHDSGRLTLLNSSVQGKSRTGDYEFCCFSLLCFPKKFLKFAFPFSSVFKHSLIVCACVCKKERRSLLSLFPF